MLALVTGGSAFVGKVLCASLLESGHTVRLAQRSVNAKSGTLGQAVVGQIDAETDWSAALKDVEVVLTARVHVINDQFVDPLAEFCRVNVDGSLSLAKQAALAGVKWLIYMSSVKMSGEYTLPGHPLKNLTLPTRKTPMDSLNLRPPRGRSLLRQYMRINKPGLNDV